MLVALFLLPPLSEQTTAPTPTPTILPTPSPELPAMPLIATTVTTSRRPALTWPSNSFIPTTSPNFGNDGSSSSVNLGNTKSAPTLVMYGFPSALAFIACLMLIPSFFVWCCMRRPKAAEK
ncbi:hypothetical protein BGZ79_001968 [Entomortierella chlamydospora]|nr:hypothetical protein BGZ79_001968 [Entomortierella chlamydospora]